MTNRCVHWPPRRQHFPSVIVGNPPTDGGGLTYFYHNWTNSILQQLKRNFWKIADALFRISTMTNLFKYCDYRPYSLVPDPQICRKCEASAIPERVDVLHSNEDASCTAWVASLLKRKSISPSLIFSFWKNDAFFMIDWRRVFLNENHFEQFAWCCMKLSGT
jgi:hypothetical protein